MPMTWCTKKEYLQMMGSYSGTYVQICVQGENSVSASAIKAYLSFSVNVRKICILKNT